MHVASLWLADFRSYELAEASFGPGISVLVGHNGQGKTNFVEAIGYLSTLASHRVSTDAPLVRMGAGQAFVKAEIRRSDGRSVTVEVEISPGRANRARLNRSPLSRARDILGVVRTVLFAPEDIALVKGDPSERRRFLDDLLVIRSPRIAGVRRDYDRVLKQRNTLLKTVRAAHGASARDAALGTLAAWDDQLARAGADLLAARLAVVQQLQPLISKGYAQVAPGQGEASVSYRPSLALDEVDEGSREHLAAALLAEVSRRRSDELDRGVSLVGPHRDDLDLQLGAMPAKGFASHGESWSFALALRLASYDLLRADGDDPILILDDVFAELDAERRRRLAALVAQAEQVLVTCAVDADVPEGLSGERYEVGDGRVRSRG